MQTEELHTRRTDYSSLKMTEKDFQMFSELIYAEVGIKMPPAKKLMLTSRLSKRLRACGIHTYSGYYDYIHTPEGKRSEFRLMIDVVTTNKTDFFREPAHFDYLIREALPALEKIATYSPARKLNLWSAGCSSGEEAYTTAFVLSDYFMKNRGGDFRILATDVCRRVLSKGSDAVYSEEAIEPIPQQMRRKYLMKGKGAKSGFYRIVPEVRQKVNFKELNFMDRKFDIGMAMDIIFCRNVVIYFDKKTQIDVFNKLYDCLMPGGYLFIGSSETLFGINSRLKAVGPTVYRKVD